MYKLTDVKVYLICRCFVCCVVHHVFSGLSADFLLHSDGAASVSEGSAARATLSPVQSLAVTTLNMLSQSRTAAATSSGKNR